MSAKHTQGELRSGSMYGDRKYMLFINGYAMAVIQIDERRLPSTEEIEERDANAAHLALCWNMHDRAVGLLRASLNMVEGDGCPPSWDEIRALLAEIDGAS